MSSYYVQPKDNECHRQESGSRLWVVLQRRGEAMRKQYKVAYNNNSGQLQEGEQIICESGRLMSSLICSGQRVSFMHRSSSRVHSPKRHPLVQYSGRHGRRWIHVKGTRPSVIPAPATAVTLRTDHSSYGGHRRMLYA